MILSPGWVPTADDVSRLLSSGRVIAHFQPIVNLGDGRVIGYEALARMSLSADPSEATDEPTAPPDRWIAAAAAAGRRTELELRCLEAALSSGLPPADGLLFVNISASTFGDRRAVHLFAGCHDRVVLELSESEVVSDYRMLREQVFAWTSRGARLAIDDTGSGYASLRHVLQLRPDFIKLDRSLVSGLDRDRNRRALADALVAFAAGVGAEVIAEGVEHAAEVAELRAVGVGLVQGYLLARPGPAWPDAADPSVSLDEVVPTTLSDLAALLALAADPRGACEAAAGYLSSLDALLPSVYLLRGARLRCEAQRGIWQVLDGMAPGIGVTGRCFAEDADIIVNDVGADERYLEAIPGVRAEVCVPIRVDGLPVGALNVEAHHEISPDLVDQVRQCARLLGERLREVGRAPTESPLDLLSDHVHPICDADTVAEVEAELLAGARHIAGMNSAAIARLGESGEVTVCAVGPLSERLEALSASEYLRLARLVEEISSCYTAGSTLDEGFIGLDDLRRSGVRGLVVVPLRSAAQQLGLLMVAHNSPCTLSTRDVEPIELLGSIAAGRMVPLGSALLV